MFESFKNINVVWTTRQVAEQACFKEFISKTACNFMRQQQEKVVN